MMTYRIALNLLGVKKAELVELFNASKSYIWSQPLDKKLSKSHTIIILKQLEVNELENLLQQKGFGVARDCDDCKVKFEHIRLREEGDEHIVCDSCYKKYIKKGDKLLIDGSWFEDNQNRGYIVKDDGRTFVIHQDEKLYIEDIPLSKITVFEKLEFDDSEIGIFID